jgi:Tfp pilus assembly protein PilN
MPDWKKEVRVSDLFKRKRSKDAPDSADSLDPAEPVPADWQTQASAVQLPQAHTPDPSPVSSVSPASPEAQAQHLTDPAGTIEHPVQHAPAQPPQGEHPTQPPPAVDSPSVEHLSVEHPSSNPAAAHATPEVPTPREHQESAHATTTPSTATTAQDGERDSSTWNREFRATDLLKKMGWSDEANSPRGGKASEQRTPRPQSPKPDSPVESAKGDKGKSMWKREIRAGDLFRRRESAPAVPADAFSGNDDEPVSFWKKELGLSDLLRTSGEHPASGAVQAPSPSATPPVEGELPPGADGAPGETPDGLTASDSAGKKDKNGKKGKSRGLPKVDLKLGALSLGKKGSSSGGPATTPIAIPLTRAVNLLPPDLAQQAKRKFGPAEIGVAIAGLVVIVGLVIAVMSASGRVSDAQDQLLGLEAEKAALEASALQLATGTIAEPDPLLGEEAARATALSDALASRTAWDRILRSVSIVMPADTWLRGLSGTSTTSDIDQSVGAETELSDTVTLTGFSRTREDIAQLLTRMETIPDLAAVQLLAATVTEIGGEEVVEFSITATLEESVQQPAPVATPIGVTP